MDISLPKQVPCCFDCKSPFCLARFLWLLVLKALWVPSFCEAERLVRLNHALLSQAQFDTCPLYKELVHFFRRVSCLRSHALRHSMPSRRPLKMHAYQRNLAEWSQSLQYLLFCT